MNYGLRALIFAFVAVVLLTAVIPFDVSAQEGLVPCGTQTHPAGKRDAQGNDISGQVSNPCQPCHIFSLAQNIFTFIWKFLALPLAILMFAYGGFLMLIPGIGGEKSVPMYQKGRKVLTNAVFGILIIFLAWLTVDTIIKVLAGQFGSEGPARIPTKVGFSPGNLGPWNKIECSTAPSSFSPGSQTQTVTQSGQGAAPTITGSTFSVGETQNRNTFAKLGIQVNKNPARQAKVLAKCPAAAPMSEAYRNLRYCASSASKITAAEI